MKPQPIERLEKTLARVSKEQGVAQERLRRWVSFLALCGVLERAVSEGILDNYDLKGGVALELRFAEGARATKDIDIGVPVERAKRLRVFQDAVVLGPSGRGVVEHVVPTIQGVAAMGLRVPPSVRCLNLSEQIAQKLHACTG